MIRWQTLTVALLAFGCTWCVGCGDDDDHSALPTPTPAPTVSQGPVVTFFGVTRADDVLIAPSSTDSNGVPVYERSTGSGVRLVVEGMPGASGAAVGTSVFQQDLTSFPDLLIQAARSLGDGNPAVCEPREMPGGVPAINPPSFDPTQTNINAVNDFACRFSDGPRTRTDDSCVKFPPTDDYHFVQSNTTIQFCGFISGFIEFPSGDTLVTVRLRDQNGNIGAQAQLVIRVTS